MMQESLTVPISAAGKPMCMCRGQITARWKCTSCTVLQCSRSPLLSVLIDGCTCASFSNDGSKASLSVVLWMVMQKAEKCRLFFLLMAEAYLLCLPWTWAVYLMSGCKGDQGDFSLSEGLVSCRC